MNPGVLNYGCAFYPEVFGPPSEKEIAFLHELNMNFVRMGEFAWSTFEPEPGEYHFDLFEETIETLGKAGIRTVLCTPGATPPIWLTHEHPERCVLDRVNVTKDDAKELRDCAEQAALLDYRMEQLYQSIQGSDV